MGFEPTKHFASDLKADPFDHSGKLAKLFLNRFSLILRSGFDPLTSGHDIGPTLSLTELTE